MAASVIVFVAGAVLAFAVNVSPGADVNVQTVGEILMGAGAFGGLASLIAWVAREAGRGSSRGQEVVASPYQPADPRAPMPPYQAR